MKAIVYFLLAAQLMACTAGPTEETPQRQAVRAVTVHHGPMVEGRRYVAEVMPDRTVKVLAQVPGAVSDIFVREGEAVSAGTSLVRISAPDIAARISRVKAERRRAQNERNFACTKLETDRKLAAAGDLPALQLDISEKSCRAANIAVDAVNASEREASVAGRKSDEKAPFAGEVLHLMVDEGQTVMPGTPLLTYGSHERQLRIRVPDRDTHDLKLGTRVQTESFSGRVVEIGAQALGPGRLVEVWIASESPLDLRPGSTTTATVVLDERENTTSVPIDALGEMEGRPYILVIDGEHLQHVDVTVGPQQEGWVSIEPPLPEGTRVVAAGLATLDPNRPILAVQK